jgi:2-polyprenyl-6-methoxyphenol hydroxylase-like FAD-dependent oxidoreductase
LLAVRVLADFYETVTVIERDKLSDTVDQRRGVELVADGAAVCDDGDLSRVSIRVDGHELNRSGKFGDPSAVALHLLSRPLLESHVRQRVAANGNVEVLDGHDFVEPIAPTPHRVTRADIVNRDTGAQQQLDADLVVDAMGRGARSPAFLDGLGYGRPVAERSPTTAKMTFAPRVARRSPKSSSDQ